MADTEPFEKSNDKRVFDAGVIGGGVVGLTTAFELAARGKRVILFEKEDDFGQGVSGNHSGVIHVLQPPFRSEKSKLARRGNRMYDRLCSELGVPLLRLPALLVVRKWWRIVPLAAGYVYLRLVLRGEYKVSFLLGKRLHALEPALSRDVVAGMAVEGYGIVDGKALIRALVSALERKGVTLKRSCRVTEGRVREQDVLVRTDCGEYVCTYLINAAGLSADEVARLLGDDFGRLSRGAGVTLEIGGVSARCIIAPFTIRGSPRTKGGGIIPTLQGTVLLGPSFWEVTEGEEPRPEGFRVQELIDRFSPLLLSRDSVNVARVMVGTRPLSPTGDFIIKRTQHGRVIHLIGMESPGLTAAPAIAEVVAGYVCGPRNG